MLRVQQLPLRQETFWNVTALGYFCTGTFRHWCWKVDVLTRTFQHCTAQCTVPLMPSAETSMVVKHPWCWNIPVLKDPSAITFSWRKSMGPKCLFQNAGSQWFRMPDDLRQFKNDQVSDFQLFSSLGSSLHPKFWWFNAKNIFFHLNDHFGEEWSDLIFMIWAIFTVSM